MNETREPHSPSTRVEGGRVAFDHILGRQYTVFDGLAGMHVEDIYLDRGARRRGDRIVMRSARSK